MSIEFPPHETESSIDIHTFLFNKAHKQKYEAVQNIFTKIGPIGIERLDTLSEEQKELLMNKVNHYMMIVETHRFNVDGGAKEGIDHLPVLVDDIREILGFERVETPEAVEA